MTNEGSLWNAPGVKSMYGSTGTQTTATVHSKTANKEHPDVKGNGTPNGANNAEQAGQDLASGKDAGAGRAAAKDAQNQQAGVRNAAAESQENTKTANSMSSDAQEISKETKKANQQFKTNSNKQQSALKQTNNQINTITQSINAEQAELNSMNSELESLLNADKTGMGSHSAFSLNLAGTEQSGGVDAGNADMAKIQDLQTRIGEKGNVIKLYNTQVAVLTKQSSASLRSLERVNTQYVKSNQKTQKAAEGNQSEVSTFMKNAAKANEIAVTVTNIGTTVKTAGMAFIAMGGIPIIGAGLAAAGHVMKPIGEATEAVGQFGQTAANVMLAAGNIAEGNLAGALTNIATAVQTGASAVKSTKAAKADFQEAFKQADGAGKMAETALEKSDELKEKAESKMQETPKAPTENAPKAPVDNSTQTSGIKTSTINNTGNPELGGTSTTRGPVTPSELNKPADLSNMTKGVEIPDKIEIKEGSTLDKFNKQQQADMMKKAKNAALKQEAKAAWADLKSNAESIKKTLTAFAPGSSNKTTTTQTLKRPELSSEQQQKYVQMRKQGVSKNAALQIIYGSDYNNFMAYKASKKHVA